MIYIGDYISSNFKNYITELWPEQTGRNYAIDLFKDTQLKKKLYLDSNILDILY